MTDSIRVLHVDDDPEFAELVALYLQRDGEDLTVETEGGADAGLERLESESFDCVVSDYDMPGRNGIEFLEAVRKRDPELPFILFTGKGSEEVASEAISAGVTEYLQKETGSGQYTVLANRIRNTVEQYRSARAAEAAERTLSELAGRTDDILFMFDGDWSELLFINSAYEEIWGRPIEELEADPRSFLEHIHPDDRERAETAMARLSDGEAIDIEYRVCRPDGEVRWIRGKTKPVCDEDGEVVRILGSVRDVTDRKVQEEALKEKERRYQAVFNDPNILVGLLDVDGTTVDVNSTAVEYIDADLADVQGDLFWKTPWFSHSEALQAEVREWVERAANGEYVEFETTLERPDGTLYAIEGVFRPVRNDDGEVVSLLVSDREVTERERRARRLQEERQFIDSVLDALPDAFYAFETDGYLTRWNEELEVVTGYSSDEIEEMHVTEFVPEEEVETIQAAFDRIVEDGEIVTLESAFETKGGETIPHEFTGAPLLSGDGSICGVTGVGRDISARLERERAVREERDRLEEFAGVVSHDLRGPLGVAAGRLELAREDCDSEHHAPIGAAHDRMERIIDGLLWLAREGQDIGETTPVDLVSVAEDAWTTSVDGAHGSATLTVADDARAAPKVVADPDRLRQLLENLFRNAIDHGDDDVSVRLAVTDGGFAVEDDGPGIPADEREQVFDVGYSSAADGSGLGLAIVDQIAEAHGWQVAVDEGSDGGARIEVSNVDFVSAE